MIFIVELRAWKCSHCDGTADVSRDAESRATCQPSSLLSAASWSPRIYERGDSLLMLFETVISDPNDPKFDLEGYLTALMGEKAKGGSIRELV